MRLKGQAAPVGAPDYDGYVDGPQHGDVVGAVAQGHGPDTLQAGPAVLFAQLLDSAGLVVVSHQVPEPASLDQLQSGGLQRLAELREGGSRIQPQQRLAAQAASGPRRVGG